MFVIEPEPIGLNGLTPLDEITCLYLLNINCVSECPFFSRRYYVLLLKSRISVEQGVSGVINEFVGEEGGWGVSSLYLK